MKHPDTRLFKTGEVVKFCGITRKTLLVYEEMGLMLPSVRDEESGYRYYTADDMTQIRAIRTMQTLGLSLAEVKEYYQNPQLADKYLLRLMEMRDLLDKNIHELLLRSVKRGDLTIRKTHLSRQVCFGREYPCQTIQDIVESLRITYTDAARTNKMSLQARMFTIRRQAGETQQVLCCIPVDESYDGPERMEFPATPAICIYHRGPYEELPLAIRTLKEYVDAQQVAVTGPYRSIYLEGPPQHGANSANYVTQIAIPIKDDPMEELV